MKLCVSYMHFYAALIFKLFHIMVVYSMMFDSTQKIEMIVAQLKIVEFVKIIIIQE